MPLRVDRPSMRNIADWGELKKTATVCGCVNHENLCTWSFSNLRIAAAERMITEKKMWCTSDSVVEPQWHGLLTTPFSAAHPQVETATSLEGQIVTICRHGTPDASFRCSAGPA